MQPGILAFMARAHSITEVVLLEQASCLLKRSVTTVVGMEGGGLPITRVVAVQATKDE